MERPFEIFDRKYLFEVGCKVKGDSYILHISSIAMLLQMTCGLDGNKLSIWLYGFLNLKSEDYRASETGLIFFPIKMRFPLSQ